MITSGDNDVLLIGYGNPGRLDDGLGPALAQRLEALALPGLTVEADYQLTVEDAAEAAQHGTVVFADADVAGPEPFGVRRIYPGSSRLSFSSHSMDPEAVLALARTLFSAEPEAYVLGIRGYQFNAFGEELSEKAQDNLAAAVTYVTSALAKRAFEEVRPEGVDRASTPIGTDKGDSLCRTVSM